jgi:hypothetical protein
MALHQGGRLRLRIGPIARNGQPTSSGLHQCLMVAAEHMATLWLTTGNCSRPNVVANAFIAGCPGTTIFYACESIAPDPVLSG